jgi:hypothetical protein
MNKIKIIIKFPLSAIHALLTQFGINLLKFKKIIHFPKFFIDLIKYIKLNGKIDYLFPVIGEHLDISGEITNHYFYQDMIVASYIQQNNPIKHVDVGSRLDGFVSHIASFRAIEVFDIRNNKINFKNIKFTKMDLNNINHELENYTDSLSCLHTIEHIGLGRYGDAIDPKEHLKAFNNLIKLLKNNGLLYISFPISQKTRSIFNSERRFHPIDILQWSDQLQLKKFDYINDSAGIFYDVDLLKFNPHQLINGCGIYTFQKVK